MGRGPKPLDEAPIWRSAYRHGYSDDQIRHALRNNIAAADRDKVTLFLGPTGDGVELIEVGVIWDDETQGPAVIHAMLARLERFFPER